MLLQRLVAFYYRYFYYTLNCNYNLRLPPLHYCWPSKCFPDESKIQRPGFGTRPWSTIRDTPNPPFSRSFNNWLVSLKVHPRRSCKPYSVNIRVQNKTIYPFIRIWLIRQSWTQLSSANIECSKIGCVRSLLNNHTQQQQPQQRTDVLHTNTTNHQS